MKTWKEIVSEASYRNSTITANASDKKTLMRVKHVLNALNLKFTEKALNNIVTFYVSVDDGRQRDLQNANLGQAKLLL